MSSVWHSRAAVAVGAVAALALAVHLKRKLARRKLIASLGGAILVEDRCGASVTNGQRVQLSPAEAAMVKVSLFMSGSMKVTTVSVITGGVTLDQLQHAAEAMQRRHPVLRSKVVLASPPPATVTSTFILEVDESIRLPVAIHSPASNDNGSVESAWRTVYSSFEKVSAFSRTCSCLLNTSGTVHEYWSCLFAPYPTLRAVHDRIRL
jgi:hypothetical protein